MTKNTFTVIINTYPSNGRAVELTKLLDSLYAQTYKAFVILIVENYKDQKKILPILKKYSGKKQAIKVINNPIKKLSVLFDLGWRNAQTDYLAYVADDVYLENSWLENVYKNLIANKKTGIVTGPLISTCYPTGEMHRLYLLSQKNSLYKALAWPYLFFTMEGDILKPANLFESGAYSIGQALPESLYYKKQKVDLATTSCMGIKKEVLKNVDGFDYRFNFNHADGDLFIRIRKLGYNIIFNPQVIGYHTVRLGPSRNAYIVGFDTGVYYRKHVRPKSIYGIVGALLNICVLNTYWVYSFIRTKDKAQLSGIAGFFRGLLVSY